LHLIFDSVVVFVISLLQSSCGIHLPKQFFVNCCIFSVVWLCYKNFFRSKFSLIIIHHFCDIVTLCMAKHCTSTQYVSSNVYWWPDNLILGGYWNLTFRCIGIPLQGLVQLLHLSKCTHVTTWELLNRFSWNLVLKNLWKTVKLLQFSFMYGGYFSGHFMKTRQCCHLSPNYNFLGICENTLCCTWKLQSAM